MLKSINESVEALVRCQMRAGDALHWLNTQLLLQLNIKQLAVQLLYLPLQLHRGDCAAFVINIGISKWNLFWLQTARQNIIYFSLGSNGYSNNYIS